MCCLGSTTRVFLHNLESKSVTLNNFPTWPAVAVGSLCSLTNSESSNSSFITFLSMTEEFPEERKLIFLRWSRHFHRINMFLSVQCVFWHHFLHHHQCWYVTHIRSRFENVKEGYFVLHFSLWFSNFTKFFFPWIQFTYFIHHFKRRKGERKCCEQYLWKVNDTVCKFSLCTFNLVIESWISPACSYEVNIVYEQQEKSQYSLYCNNI